MFEDFFLFARPFKLNKKKKKKNRTKENTEQAFQKTMN